VGILLVRIGDVEKSRDDRDRALERYTEGLEICRALMAELGTAQSRRDVSTLLGAVASIEQERGDLDGALARYEECLEIDRALVRELGTTDNRHEVSNSLSGIGNIEAARGNPAGAIARYEEALEINRALMTETGTPWKKCGVICSLCKIGGVEEARSNLDGALDHYAEAMKIASALMTETGLPMFSVLFLLTTERAATCHLALTKPDIARAVLQPAELVAIALESDARNDFNAMDTVAAYWEVRAETAAHSDPQEASTCAARAASIRTRIADSNAE
jgi:tetratricopeptide (TPR) repeat protein